mmetsp:Transcript_9223/g.29345  ORF Transcript_9223/g.29345 Transcript_9223/m.29345 type:complete len:136 (-) Transcript_9223:1053-1460(-)
MTTSKPSRRVNAQRNPFDRPFHPEESLVLRTPHLCSFPAPESVVSLSCSMYYHLSAPFALLWDRVEVHSSSREGGSALVLSPLLLLRPVPSGGPRHQGASSGHRRPRLEALLSHASSAGRSSSLERLDRDLESER